MSLVSIIIPTFNRCSLLQRAINSVYKQTYNTYEIIIVDDGSTDGTDKMIQDLFPEVRYLHQRNAGVSSARNKGIKAAKGEWIAFLDSDDEWLPLKLSNQICLLNSEPNYKICHTEEQWVRDGVRVNQMKKHKKKGGWIFTQCLPLCAMSPSSIVINNSVFTETGLFDATLPACEDYDMWLRITAKYPVLYIEEPQIIKYGGHSGQLSKQHWGMDRYRITALQNIINGSALTEQNKQAAITTLLKKCKIFQQGALKRGRRNDALYYQSIVDKYNPHS